MAIFTDDDDIIDNSSGVQTSHSFKTREELKTSIIYNKDEPVETISNYISGKPWAVDYFLTIRDINDTVSHPDVNKSPAIQKYNRINNLELLLQTSIEQEEFENISGDAIINAGFMPSVGDPFKAKLLGGREVIFTLETVEKKNYNLRDVYYVTFKLFATIDEEETVYNDILLKTVKEYVYDKNHLLDYSAPVILASDFKSKINLKRELDVITDYYLTKFINKDKNVLALPTTTGIYIDTFLTKFIFKIIEFTKFPNMTNLNRFDDVVINNIDYTIWDAIASRNITLLNICNKDLKFKYTPNTTSYAISRHLSYLGINYVVGINSSAIELPLKEYSLDVTKDISKPVSENDNSDYSYVLSNNFYNNTNTDKLSSIELLLLDFLNGKMLDIAKVKIAVDEYKYWKTIDQFYVIPILLVLIKDSINNTFVSI